MALISVIVPVYNVEKYLNRCVDSILGQTFTNFELVLVDDGSTDNSPSICDEYAEKDSRIHVIHQQNGGLSAARNAGIDWSFAHSNSEWLTFIDSDDFIDCRYLEVLYSGIEKYNADISACALTIVNSGNISDIASPNIPETIIMNPEQAYVEHYPMCMCAPCKLFRKPLFENYRFPLGKLHEDAFITHKIVFSAQKFAVTDTPLYYYFENTESITRAQWHPKRLDEYEAHEERLRFLFENKHYDALNKEIFAYIYVFTYQFDLLNKSEKTKENEHYRDLLTKKLRKIIRVCKKITPIPFKEYTHIYELAYPKAVSLYWFFKSVLKKLHIIKE